MISSNKTEYQERANMSNMKAGLDHWTTGPLMPLTALPLIVCTNTWDEQHENRSGPLDHWTTPSSHWGYAVSKSIFGGVCCLHARFSPLLRDSAMHALKEKHQAQIRSQNATGSIFHAQEATTPRILASSCKHSSAR